MNINVGCTTLITSFINWCVLSSACISTYTKYDTTPIMIDMGNVQFFMNLRSRFILLFFTFSNFFQFQHLITILGGKHKVEFLCSLLHKSLSMSYCLFKRLSIHLSYDRVFCYFLE